MATLITSHPQGDEYVWAVYETATRVPVVGVVGGPDALIVVDYTSEDREPWVSAP